MATTRIRKTFRYPTDDDDPLPEHLDEQEQEGVISTLRREDFERNAFYTKLFLALPLLLCLPYLPLFLASKTTYQTRLLVLLSLTSLLSTAYTLKYIPLNRKPPDRKGKRPIRAPSSTAGLSSSSSSWAEEDGPLKRYLGWLNAVLCVLLGVVALSERRNGMSAKSDEAGWWVMWLVPGLVFALLMVARRIMSSVDIGSLEDLRYEYKGA